MKLSNRAPLCSAFTLIEVIVVIAILAITAGIAMQSIGDINQGAQRAQVESSIQTVNEALSSYLGSGGNFEDTNDPKLVLTRLKSTMETKKASTFLGFTGSFLDENITLTEEKNPSEGWYVKFDPVRKQFYPIEVGPENKHESPLFRFAIGQTNPMESAATQQEAGTDNRKSTFTYAEKDTWVWDFREKSAGDRDGTTDVTTGDPTESDPPDILPDRILSAPDISVVTQLEKQPPPAPRIEHFVRLTNSPYSSMAEEFDNARAAETYDQADPDPTTDPRLDGKAQNSDVIRGQPGNNEIQLPMNWDTVYENYDVDEIYNYFRNAGTTPEGWILEYTASDTPEGYPGSEWKELPDGNVAFAFSNYAGASGPYQTFAFPFVYNFRYRKLGIREQGDPAYSETTVIRKWHHFLDLEYLWKEFGPEGSSEPPAVESYTIKVRANEDPDISYIEFNIASSPGSLSGSEPQFPHTAHAGEASAVVSAKDYPNGVFVLARNAPSAEQDEKGHRLVPSESVSGSSK